MRKILSFLVIGILVVAVHRHASRDPPREEFAGMDVQAPAPEPANLQVESAGNEPRQFSCNGRQHCREMTSCAEAQYFLAHCPGVKMDGDRDGIPCEDQWCSHLR